MGDDADPGMASTSHASKIAPPIQSQYAFPLVIDVDFFKTPEGRARFEQSIAAHNVSVEERKRSGE